MGQKKTYRDSIRPIRKGCIVDYSVMELQKKLIPDLFHVLQRRYNILKYIGLMEPVGRRNLAAVVGLTERVLRSEVDFLKNQELISVTKLGMGLTKQGKDILEALEDMMKDLTGISELEKSLRKKLGIEQVIIVAGDSDESPQVKKELGLACAHCMKKHLIGENIIAVTGGSTMDAVAEMLTPKLSKDPILFVPARGGFRMDVENQANMICAKMAQNTGKDYHVLYVPDQVREETYHSILKEPVIIETLSLIKSANMILHGIGDAMKMAERRKSSPEEMEMILKGNAVGEAFGYYFNEQGDIVHKVLTIGLQLEDLENTNTIIAVAGGASKGKAIQSYMKRAPKKTILITDEGAAKKILSLP